MGWEKTKNSDDRLFAIRTILWGLPTAINLPEEAWPVLEAGEHNFPFVCQMPVINYPPSFQHHLIATAFHMIVSVTKAGETAPILSKPVLVCFQPIIETIPVKNLQAFTEETRLTNQVYSIVSVPRLAYSIYDRNQSIDITVQLNSENNNDNITLSQLRVYIKRYYSISYKTFSRTETAVIANLDQPKLSGTCPSTITMKLKLPEESEDLPATLNYSPHLTVQYKLVVSAKVRHGPIHVKKKLFDMPIIFGTLPAGTRAPRQLEPYSNLVDNRDVINSKPTFLRPEPKNNPNEDEFLPAYGGDRPPAYPHINTSSSNNNSMRFVEITS